jgi:ABC-type lipoprotein release transport system permease subunit
MKPRESWRQSLLSRICWLMATRCCVWMFTRILNSLLYEVSPTDMKTLLGASGLLVAVALLACWLPACRAARIDPMEALRYE